MDKKPHIVIIGGGFAGVAAAKICAKADVNVTLLDKRNHHVFQPLLYQVATATLSPAQISYPIRMMFRKKKNVTVLLANVEKVDVANKQLSLKRSKRIIEYDYLIVAGGARHSYFGNPEWEKYAWGLKTNRDALKIRERLLYSLEKAERTTILEKRQRFSTFVIVGGGPTGVEMAGAIAEMTQKTIVNDFNRFDTRDSKVILIEGADRLLGRYPKNLSEQAYIDLSQMGVDVRLNQMVKDVSKKGVQVGDEFIETENIIWAAGNAASPVMESVTKDRHPMGMANVNLDFSIKEDPNVFCVGDCAYLVDANNKLVPAVAQGAMQGGTFVGRQIIRDLKGLERQQFCYFDKGKMATIGHSKAVADIWGIQFSGFLAWILWSFVHVLFLIDFRSRFGVFLDWIWSYFTHSRSVRLINQYREKTTDDLG